MIALLRHVAMYRVYLYRCHAYCLMAPRTDRARDLEVHVVTPNLEKGASTQRRAQFEKLGRIVRKAVQYCSHHGIVTGHPPLLI